MIEWTYIWIGVIFTILMVRFFKGAKSELYFFGALLGGIFSWHYEFSTFLNLPQLPEIVYRLGSGVLLSWTVYRFWLLYVTRTKRNSMVRKITKSIFGAVENLKD